MAVTCTGRIDESGSLGLELAETASRDGTTPPSIHIRAVNEGLAQRHVPGISAGMLLVTVNGVAISGVPYDTVLEMLGQRPLELGLAETPHKLPAGWTQKEHRGRPYYVNAATGDRTWNPPTA